MHDGLPSAFRIGLPALDLFPFETWSRLQNRFWRREPIQHMGYGDPAGDIQLRELIAHYLRSARGLACNPAQILVTLGAQQAIMVSAAMLLRAEDEVVMENPCYWAAAGAFSCLGVHINAVGVDDDGLLTHSSRRSLKLKWPMYAPLANIQRGSPCHYPVD